MFQNNVPKEQETVRISEEPRRTRSGEREEADTGKKRTPTASLGFSSRWWHNSMAWGGGPQEEDARQAGQEEEQARW